MGNLTADTELTQVAPGVFERHLVRDWEIWGPNGGYMAAIALRAAQRHSGRARPANASVHFLGVGNFDEPVTVTAVIQRASRQATSVAVRIEQSGHPLLSAMVWAIDQGMAGLTHDHAPMPAVPAWDQLPTVAERFAADGVEPPATYAFWENFEQRPTSWISDWANRTPSKPFWQQWMRFAEGGAPDDLWLQAARLLLLVDLGGWPSVGRRHVEEGWMAPSIDVSCEFHRPHWNGEWYLLQAESPHAGEGLVASHQHVWNEHGELLASGVSHLLCRRVPDA